MSLNLNFNFQRVRRNVLATVVLLLLFLVDGILHVSHPSR